MPVDMSEYPLEVDGNGSRIRTLTFDEADALMLASAMMTASTTAMMSANYNGNMKAKNRLEHYRTMFLEVAPPGGKHLQRDTDLCEIVIAMMDQENWSIHQHRNRSWDKKGNSIVTVGDMTWETYSLTSEQHAELTQCLVNIAPMTCNKIEKEDTLEPQRTYES